MTEASAAHVDGETSDGGLSAAVIESVAAREGVAPHRLAEPLYETINPDALDALFQRSTGTVVFEFHGYIVKVRSDGGVELTEAY